MLGMQINNENRSSSLASLSILAAVISIALGIGLGPRAVYVASGIGLLLGTGGLFTAAKASGLFRPTGFPAVAVGCHLLLLGVAVVLQLLFLTPLSRDVQRMPRLQFRYVDHESGFTLRGPQGWSYESLPIGFDSGVRIRPAEQKHYMGASEITVLVRRLDAKPSSIQEFLENIAHNSVEQKKAQSRLFKFEVAPAELLSKNKGTWSVLDIKRFWIPIRQVSLFGMKNGRYLCSVSVIGLQAHSALSKVLCLGLFETVIVPPPNKK